MKRTGIAASVYVNLYTNNPQAQTGPGKADAPDGERGPPRRPPGTPRRATGPPLRLHTPQPRGVFTPGPNNPLGLCDPEKFVGSFAWVGGAGAEQQPAPTLSLQGKGWETRNNNSTPCKGVHLAPGFALMGSRLSPISASGQ